MHWITMLAQRLCLALPIHCDFLLHCNFLLLIPRPAPVFAQISGYKMAWICSLCFSSTRFVFTMENVKRLHWNEMQIEITGFSAEKGRRFQAYDFSVKRYPLEMLKSRMLTAVGPKGGTHVHTPAWAHTQLSIHILYIMCSTCCVYVIVKGRREKEGE